MAYGEDQIQKTEVGQRVKSDYTKRAGGEEERDGKQSKRMPRKIVYFKRHIKSYC
jgi:hypothetical protein